MLLPALLFDALLDLLLGSRCVGCGRPGRRWCAGCARALAGPARPASPDPTPPGMPPVWAVGENVDPVAAAVIAHKDRGVAGLVRPLGEALAGALLAAYRAGVVDGASSGRVWVVPVPTTRRAVRRRGYDPLARIARRAVARCGAELAGAPDLPGAPDVPGMPGRPRGAGGRPRVVSALRVTRPVADQVGLGASGRASNVHGAYAARRRYRDGLRGRRVLVVDDLVTSGATLTEAARALAAAGATVVGASVVAATPREPARGERAARAGDSRGRARSESARRVPTGAGSG